MIVAINARSEARIVVVSTGIRHGTAIGTGLVLAASETGVECGSITDSKVQVFCTAEKLCGISIAAGRGAAFELRRACTAVKKTTSFGTGKGDRFGKGAKVK
jgi:hypothetical protein